MSFKKDDLTSKQLDSKGRSKWAVFLPALSSFYSTYVGKQRHNPTNVDPARIPADFEHGIEGLNWLNPQEAYFPYKWALYSAGHADLDVHRVSPKEDMVRNRDRKNSFVLGDSGGFQIGKGVWEGDWKDPSCPKASQKRKQVLEWLDAYMDRGMILDIPAWVARSPAGAKATGISTYEEAVKATEINNDYFMKNRNGNCKFLNVLQGENHTDADRWYNTMKHYCDPSKHEQPFEGWAMGGQNMCSPTLALKRLVTLREDKLLEKGLHDWMHFLGTSKLEWAVLLTDMQNAVRKHHNEDFTISFDCASPFLATANGQIYTTNEFTDRKKWAYRMNPSVDNKKYATDTRRFRDALLADGIFTKFDESPISERMTIRDICIYKPDDLNKIGKEGRTSWDSFSYALQMGHNVHRHLDAVQQANMLYETKTSCPSMLVDERHDRLYFTQLVDEIFASDTGRALELIEDHDKFLTKIIGTRGATGKKETNAGTFYGTLFEEEVSEHHIDDSGFNENALDDLEKDL